MTEPETTTPEATPADPPAADPPAGDPPADKMYSVDQVNKIVQERLARDRKDRPSDEEIEAWKDKATKFDEVELANASDLDKATKRADEAEKRETAATERANTALRRAAIVAAATQEGADPDVVHALLADKGFKVAKDDGEIEVSVSETGEVVGVTDAVKAIVEAKSLGTGSTPPPSDGGARTPVPAKDLDEQIKEAEAKGDAHEVIRLNNQKLLLLKQKQEQAAA